MLYWDSQRITKAFSVLIDFFQSPLKTLQKKKYGKQVCIDFIAIMYWIQALVTSPFLYKTMGVEAVIINILLMFFISLPLAHASLWLNSYIIYMLAKLFGEDHKRESYYPVVSLPNIILLLPMQGVFLYAGSLAYIIQWYLLFFRVKMSWYASTFIVFAPAALFFGIMYFLGFA